MTAELYPTYRHLLITVITDGKVSIGEIEPFLPEEEVAEVVKQVVVHILPPPVNVDVYFYQEAAKYVLLPASTYFAASC